MPAVLMNVDAVRAMVRSKLRRTKMTQTQYAALCGFSSAFLSMFLHGKKKPNPSILEDLGLELIERYKRKP